MTFAIERTIDGIESLKDEDYIEAESRDEADLKLMMGILSVRFDLTCKIIGLIIDEIEISTDEMLDIMITETEMTEEVRIAIKRINLTICK